MNKKTYSLSEMVARIAGRNTDAGTSLARQIRGWTDSGFLPVDGATHSGRGRHRRYSETALYIAVVLHRLARMGIGSGCLALVSKELQEVATGKVSQEYRHLWCDAIAGTRPVVAAFELAIVDKVRGVGLDGFWLYEAGKVPPEINNIPATAGLALTSIFSGLHD